MCKISLHLNSTQKDRRPVSCVYREPCLPLTLRVSPRAAANPQTIYREIRKTHLWILMWICSCGLSCRICKKKNKKKSNANLQPNLHSYLQISLDFPPSTSMGKIKSAHKKSVLFLYQKNTLQISKSARKMSAGHGYCRVHTALWAPFYGIR